MRFAIIDLLALTLLTCLAVAIYVKRQAISATTLDLATLQAETEQAADLCQEQEPQIELLTRTINRRVTDLDRLSPMVDHLAQLLNQAALSMAEPAPHEGTVSREFIPTFSRDDEFRERTKIYVPANLACELQVKFMDGDGNPGFFEEFEEPRRHSVPLVVGENLVEVHFDWYRAPNTFTVTNHTSGVSIRARAKDARGPGWSPGLGQGSYAHGSFSRERGMTVFAGVLAFKKGGTRIVVRMVESKKQ
jgi:hypothetical protein